MIIFDMDGTLVEHRMQIKDDVATALPNNSVVVSGASLEKMARQLEPCLDKVHSLWGCCGNEWIVGSEQGANLVNYDEILVNAFESQQRIHQKIFSHGRACIENRKGLMVYAPFGFNLSSNQRQSFMKYDEKHSLRDRIIEHYSKRFTDYEFYKGGQTSIDICKKGFNKAQILNHLPEGPHIFVTDNPKGNDKPLCDAVHSFIVTGGPKQTLEILNEGFDSRWTHTST